MLWFLFVSTPFASALWTDSPSPMASPEELSHLSTLLSALEFYTVKAECGSQITCENGHIVALDLSAETSGAFVVGNRIFNIVDFH
jgi:hypothetical protein